MARNLESKCTQCRRAGEKLFLKGARCFSPKCAMNRRPFAPGDHGQKRSGQPSEYAQQLREKQKLKKMYRLLERQFAGYFDRADRKEGVTTDNLLQILESRLDNVVYRLGFAASRDMARQLVNHGHLQVNGRSVDIPSFEVRTGDVISIKESRLKKPVFADLENSIDVKTVPEWLELDVKKMAGTVAASPMTDTKTLGVDLRYVVEFYSK